MNGTAQPLENPEAEANDIKASAAALAVSTGAILAQSACCIVPIGFPAIALALGATTLAWMKAARTGMTVVSLLMLAGAWYFVWRQTARSGKRAARSTKVMLGGATLLTVVALGWRWVEPVLLDLVRP
jgi:hypothetical protein